MGLLGVCLVLEICFWREDRGNPGLPECMGEKGGVGRTGSYRRYGLTRLTGDQDRSVHQLYPK